MSRPDTAARPPVPAPVTPPVQLVIFGLTGDLARRYLLPALYQLVRDHWLAPATRVVGVSRRAVAPADVLAFMYADSAYDPAVVKQLESVIDMFQMDLIDPAGYTRLKTYLDHQEQALGVCAARLFYLSMPPQTFGPVIDLLGSSGMSDGCAHGDRAQSRLLIEKPFGFDLVSAEELVGRIAQQFNQEQLYRIDHYVAKEASQNLLAFRLHNPVFQGVWDSKHIDLITVTAAEAITVQGRAFYDQLGALRDIIQNHLLQLLALATMDVSANANSDAIHAAKLKLLQTIPTVAPNKVASQTRRGQYSGYRDEVGNGASITETFAAVRVEIDNDRWRGVPVVLQTGKALDQKFTEITFRFRATHPDQPTNQLTIRIEPGEGICLDLLVKKPGLGHDIERVEMDFRYGRSFTDRNPNAYERVLADALRGDRTLFTTSAETLECWRILDPVVAEWAKTGDDLTIYQPGTPIGELSRGLAK